MCGPGWLELLVRAAWAMAAGLEPGAATRPGVRPSATPLAHTQARVGCAGAGSLGGGRARAPGPAALRPATSLHTTMAGRPRWQVPVKIALYIPLGEGSLYKAWHYHQRPWQKHQILFCCPKVWTQQCNDRDHHDWRHNGIGHVVEHFPNLTKHSFCK